MLVNNDLTSLFHMWLWYKPFQKCLHLHTGSFAQNIFRHVAGLISLVFFYLWCVDLHIPFFIHVFYFLFLTRFTCFICLICEHMLADDLGAAGCSDSDDNPNRGKRENKMWSILARAWRYFYCIIYLCQYWLFLLFSLAGAWRHTIQYLYFHYSLFFPTGTSITCGNYTVVSENIENYEDFIVTDLR